MAELKNCEKCRMSTAHVDGACQRCAFRKANAKKKPMTAEAKEALRQLRLWRAGKRDTDPRLDTEHLDPKLERERGEEL